jgi:uncharacterized protein (UPF0276 family)
VLSALPPNVGVGLKPQHYDAALQSAGTAHGPAWVEVHPQNYFGVDNSDDANSWGGGPPHHWLTRIAAQFPISFHSTGLSLGSSDGYSAHDLERLAILCDRYNPASVSDHLSFSGNAHDRFSDLLPMPYTYQSLDHFARQLDRVQQRLQRRLLIENPSRYLAYAHDDMTEIAFIGALVARTGCGIIFDINNVEVSAANLGFSAEAYVDAVDPDWVGEIHLAGHATENHASGPLLIDDHGSMVSEYTWRLFNRFVARSGSKPILIEWDTDVPEFSVLMTEAKKARSILDGLISGSTATVPAHAIAN